MKDSISIFAGLRRVAIPVLIVAAGIALLLLILPRIRTNSSYSLPPGHGDGGGRASIEPADPVRVATRGTWTIRFITGPDSIATGGGLVVQYPVFWNWSKPQTTDPSYPGYVEWATSVEDVELTGFASHLGWVRIVVDEGILVPGDTVIIVYGGGAGGGQAVADPYAERGQEFLIKVDGDGDDVFAEIDRSPKIDLTAGSTAQLRLFGRGEVRDGEKTELVVSALDRFGNRAPDYRGTVRFSYRWTVSGLPDHYTFTEEDRGAHAFPVTWFNAGTGRIRVVEEGGVLEAWSNPIRVIPRNRPEPYRLLWADLHQHSNFSDGTGLPEDLHSYARDVEYLDVFALTDHDHHGLRPLNEEMWNRLQAVTDSFYQPDTFVTLHAYEWTNWVYGHRNVYYFGDLREVFSTADSATNSPAELWRALPDGQSLTIAHHTGGGPVPIDWSIPPDPAYEWLVEIASVHGSSECKGCPKEIYNPIEGSFVRDALALGYRLGFIAAGDGHIGHPGETYGASGGLAGIYAGSRTREAIWEALSARRTYATSGERIILRVDLNGHWMGSVIPLAELPDQLAIEVSAWGTAPMDRADLISDGVEIATEYGSEEEFSCRFLVPRPESETYYYVRLTQMDGALAWSSPIWITPSAP